MISWNCFLRSAAAAVLAVVMVASTAGCSPSPPQSPSPEEKFTAETVRAFIGELATAGVAVYSLGSETPIVEVDSPSPMALTEEQATNEALGVFALAGITGDDIDTLAQTEPLEAGATPIPPSLLLAAWAQSARSPASVLAQQYLGKQDLADYSSVVFPSAVLTLFAADVTGNPDIPPAEPFEQFAAAPPAPESVCEQFKSFVNGTIDKVFTAIGRFETVGYSGSFFDDIVPFIRNVGAALGNLALDAVKVVIVNGVKLVIGPIVNAIASVASVLAVASTIVNTLQPWTGSIKTDPLTVRRNATANPGVAQLTVKGGLINEDWPTEIAGCARAANVELPSLKPRGADITWTLVQQQPALMVEKTSDSGPLGDDSTASMQFATIAESPDVAKGEEHNDGLVFLNVAVHRKDLDKLQEMLSGTVLNLVPDLVRQAIGPQLKSIIEPQIKALLEPIATLRDVTVRDTIAVTYHVPGEPDPDAPDGPGPTNSNQAGRVPTECPPASVVGAGFPVTAVGSPAVWERLDIDMAAIESMGSAIGVAEPQPAGTLACVYQEQGEAPDFSPQGTMVIVKVIPIERPMLAGARAVTVPGVDRAWFEATMFWAVLDGWTLGIPLFFGAVDADKATIDVAQAVIAWSR